MNNCILKTISDREWAGEQDIVFISIIVGFSPFCCCTSDCELLVTTFAF